jgi:protein phosphatase
MEDVRAGLKTLQGDEPDPDTGYSPQSLLVRQAIIKANAGIFNTARQEADCQGMGTTIVVGLFYEDRLTVAHVGDSRMYRLRGDTLEQITRDHSLIQELIARGICTPEEAAATTPKNLVTRALGIESTVEIDILEEQALPGDIYLLCSDGLNDMVDDEEIRLTLRKYSANLVESAWELVRLANEKGGRDNISVILVRKPERPAGFNGIYWRLLRFFGQG